MTNPGRIPNDSIDTRLASPLVSPVVAHGGGGGMLRRGPSTQTSGEGPRRGRDRRRGPMLLLTAATSHLSAARAARTARERVEQELRSLLRARSVVLREDGLANGQGVCVDVPGAASESRARLEVTFEPGRTPDGWSQQLLEAGAHIAALLLAVERAQARHLLRVQPPADGAAPLIGSSRAIKTLRQRIERVAATDFTVLIEGASGPEPHPNFIDVFSGAALGGGPREVEGAGEDGAELTV
jgi:hypothetical protein